jgi:K+-transporting ATPase KdpF subunit
MYFTLESAAPFCCCFGPSRRPATSFSNVLKKEICVPLLDSRGSARVCESQEEKTMDYIIAGITSVGLFVYLIYALLRPEKF